MRRTRLFMSVLITVLTAVVVCLSLSACGGSSSDDEDDITTGGSTKKGVHRLEISFSRDYNPHKDYGMYFFAFKTMTEETNIYDANGNLMPTRKAQGIEVKKTESCMYNTEGDCISFGVTMYIARSVGEAPLDVTIKGYINNKKTRERTFTIPEGKLCTIYLNTIREDSDNFRQDDLYD